MQVVNVRPRRFSLGAEELIELGQILPSRASVPEATAAAAAPGRAIIVTPEEGKLMIAVVENIISFAKEFPIEFTSYCPTDRWQSALSKVGAAIQDVELQIQAGKKAISISAEALFHMVDLEKCVSAARDARLAASRWSTTILAGAGLASWLLGISWINIPAWIASLAILYGRPLYARYQATPTDPYAPVLSGRGQLGRRCGLSGQCAIIAEKLAEEEKRDPNRRKVLERVVVAPDVEVQRHHWGIVKAAPSDFSGTKCLAKGRFRVRVEGWRDDEIIPSDGWRFTDPGDCDGQIVLAVWTLGRDTSDTPWGEVSQDSGHENTYWVEYAGPFTAGKIRRAGPFGCTVDPAAHAMEDAGFSEPGVDGDYAIFDSAGNVAVEEEVVS
jgi:hypothetical protein